jgi:hypothetical protein
MTLQNLKPGDFVKRLIGNVVTMQMVVTEVTSTRIICRAYQFDKETGGEIDEELGWDGKLRSGSRIEPSIQEKVLKKI